jgi:N-acetylmuramoyl-L-alanine amidase
MVEASNACIVKKIRVGNHQNYQRLVFDTVANSKPSYSFTQNHNEVVLTLAKPCTVSNSINLNDAKYSISRESKQHIRITANSNRFKHHLIPALRNSRQHRIIVDIYGNTSKAMPQANNGGKVKPSVITSQSTAKHKVNDKTKQKIIVLDAGHGGRDPGAIGYNGLQEKSITLTAVKELKAYINKYHPTYKVILTRADDKFIKLRDRSAIARKHGADLFISIHADSTDTSKAKGASVYTLSEKASDKEAELLAQRENQADFIGMEIKNINDNQEINDILIGLMQRETMNLSAYFASMISQSFKNHNITRKKNPHRFAGFVVLKAPDTPSVLIEMGYISNPEEEKLLKKSSYRQRLIKSITDAINEYFNQQLSS